jgi:hypothetical protein
MQAEETAIITASPDEDPALQFTEEPTATANSNYESQGGIAPRPVMRPALAAHKSRTVVDANIDWGAYRMALLVKAFLFFEGCTHNGLTHLVNVYLVALQGWTPLEASWIWFTRDAVMFFLQAYAGSIVDETRHKKSILAAAGVLKIAAGVIMVTTTAMAPQIIKGAMDGVINSLVVPAATALTLGAVGKTKFHRKHAQLNIMVKNLGVSLSAVILGAVAWAIYPDITNVFYQFIAVGILCLLCVIAMPSRDVVDHKVARGQSMQMSLSRRAMGSLLSFKDDSESEDEADEGDHSPSNEEEGATEGAAYTEVLTLRDMFSNETRRKSLVFLALTFFSYHLVNATVLPLLGQYIGTRDPVNAREVLPSMAGLVVMKELGSFFTNWFLKSRLRKAVYKPILFSGCCFLLLRLVLISILVNYTDNLWAIGSTNILEGVGIGCLDLALTLYSHLLSRQTGHYNLNMGIVSTFKTLGSALSIVLGGALATWEDYNITFPVLAVMVIFPLFFSTRVQTPDLYGRVL